MIQFMHSCTQNTNIRLETRKKSPYKLTIKIQKYFQKATGHNSAGFILRKQRYLTVRNSVPYLATLIINYHDYLSSC